MSGQFPTFERLWTNGWQLPLWTNTPWWPADTLASNQHSLLRLLLAAVDEKIEFAPLVFSLAKEQRGRYRRRLFRFAKRLAVGTPLSVALEQSPGVLSDEQMLAVRFGIQSGTLPQTLQTLIENSDSSSNQTIHRVRQVGFYGAFVGTLFFLVLTFLMIKIVPSFQAIMEDFALDITTPLKLLISVTNFLTQIGPLVILAIAFCCWLVFSDKPRRLIRRRILSRFLKPVAQLRNANLLSLMAVAQEAGRPLPGAISTLARYHYDALIRHRLLFVRNEVEQGADLWKSMASARLLSDAESRALSYASVAGSTAWTMRHLAQWKRSRVVRRLDTAVDFLLPIMVLLMAAVVLFASLAMLTPLIKMTSGLA